MKNAIGTGVAIAVVVSVGLAAQGATSSTQSPQNGISVTGCVERADPSAPAAGSTEAAPAGDKKMFILTNVMPSGAASETTGTSGGGSGSRAAASNRKFPLDADESKLTPHIGHRVEINGTFVSSGPGVGVAGAPKLKVETLRMLASSCAQ